MFFFFNYNPTNIDELEEKEYEKRLKSVNPNIPWSVKNELECT